MWYPFGWTSSVEFNSSDFTTWFYSNATGAYGRLFIVTSWMLWRARNKEVCVDCKWENWKLISRICSLLDSIQKALDKEDSPRQPHLVYWKSPLESYMKLNVDGSSFGILACQDFEALFQNTLVTDFMISLVVMATLLKSMMNSKQSLMVCS